MICTTIWLEGKRKKIVETNEQQKSKSMKNTPGPDQALLSPFSVFFNLQKKDKLFDYRVSIIEIFRFIDKTVKRFNFGPLVGNSGAYRSVDFKKDSRRPIHCQCF